MKNRVTFLRFYIGFVLLLFASCVAAQTSEYFTTEDDEYRCSPGKRPKYGLSEIRQEAWVVDGKAVLTWLIEFDVNPYPRRWVYDSDLERHSVRINCDTKDFKGDLRRAIKRELEIGPPHPDETHNKWGWAKEVLSELTRERETRVDDGSRREDERGGRYR